MLRNRTSTQKNFAISPRGEVPRSKFNMKQTRKQAFNASELVPIMCEEILPGDVWQHTEHIAARLATPIAPIIDDLDLETFYFFIPNRIVWEDWEDFITGADTALVIPTILPWNGSTRVVQANGVLDHFGILPGTYTTNTFAPNVIPIWAYFTTYNEWFRDQNLQEEWTWPSNWTADYTTSIVKGATPWDQKCLRANKRHDYFTSSLPWPQKGTAVTLPLGTTAPVIPNPVQTLPEFQTSSGNRNSPLHFNASSAAPAWNNANAPAGDAYWKTSGLVADLANATAATINAIRLAFQTQKLLERDARGGSRYVEQLMSQFGVRSPDYRLQRPEYLGGGKHSVTINPIAQTSFSGEIDNGGPTPQGNLAAEMHVGASKRTFTYAATEHGYILGLCVVRATPTYQQGTRRHWRHDTRLSYYFPAFAMLGEQAVATQEIYQPLNNAPANATWGYQERWAELRYTPNEITGVLRSTNATPMDWWHLSEEFATEPALSDEFITDKTQEVLARALATAPEEIWAAQIIMDIAHDSKVARLLPAYSVPGLIDHF